MYDDPPREFRPADLVLLEACPVSDRRKTRGPAAALDRWSVLHDAVVRWLVEGRPADTAAIEADLFAALDPVQRALATEAFRRTREAVGEASLEPDPPVVRVASPDGRVVLRVPFQFSLLHPHGDREVLRLRSTSPSTADEAAVVVLGADPDTNPGDLLADPGQVEAIDLDPDEARARVERLLAVPATTGGDRPVPGFHCWRCDRTAVCGAYPNPWGGRIPSSARTVKVSRSTLANLGTCERRVAWKAVFQVPTPERDLFGEPSGRLGIGAAFHRAMAAALVDEDPAGVFAAHAAAVSPGDRDDLLHLWEQHRALAAAEPHPVEVTRTEHPFGVTIPVEDAATAVVAIGTIDAAGREPEGTAAVVEHRTGATTTIPHLEAELYAVASWMGVGEERVAVHHHHLRAAGDACTRRVFERPDLEAALADLASAARTIAHWDPEDSLSAPHREGPWCGTCDFEPLCRRWR